MSARAKMKYAWQIMTRKHKSSEKYNKYYNIKMDSLYKITFFLHFIYQKIKVFAIINENYRIYRKNICLYISIRQRTKEVSRL